MSTTLRYEISVALGNEIAERARDLWDSFKSKRSSRWGGLGQARWQCWSFRILLPGQLLEAYALLRLLEGWLSNDQVVKDGQKRLTNKLWLSLGLPLDKEEWGGKGTEATFLAQLGHTPNALDLWLIYTDWLEETDDPGKARRAAVIRAWTGKKRVASFNGVLVTVLE